MDFTNKNILLSSTLVGFLVIASYVNFATYKPKVMKQIPEVKGMQASDSAEDGKFPMPEGVDKVSSNGSAGAFQTTYYTNKTKDEIQEFYKNIYQSNKWELDSDGVYPDMIIKRYKKDNKIISIKTFDEDKEYKTFVSIENTSL